MFFKLIDYALNWEQKVRLVILIHTILLSLLTLYIFVFILKLKKEVERGCQKLDLHLSFNFDAFDEGFWSTFKSNYLSL
jgi:hypothetical protein